MVVRAGKLQQVLAGAADPFVGALDGSYRHHAVLFGVDHQYRAVNLLQRGAEPQAHRLHHRHQRAGVVARGPVAILLFVVPGEIAVAAHQQARQQGAGGAQQQAHAAVARPEVGRQHHQRRGFGMPGHPPGGQRAAGGHSQDYCPPSDDGADAARLHHVALPVGQGHGADRIRSQAAAGQPGQKDVGLQARRRLLRCRRQRLPAAGVAVDVHQGQVGAPRRAAAPRDELLGARRDGTPGGGRDRRFRGLQPLLDRVWITRYPG